MSTTTPTRRRSARWHAENISSAQRSSAEVATMVQALAHQPADRRGDLFRDEVTRLVAIRDEYDAEIDQCIEAALLDGWDCDDIEAAS